jgi:hypothetical protein
VPNIVHLAPKATASRQNAIRHYAPKGDIGIACLVEMKERSPTEATCSYFDDFDFLIVATMALERVLDVIGFIVRFDESDPHGPATIGADRTCSGLRRIKIVRVRHLAHSFFAAVLTPTTHGWLHQLVGPLLSHKKPLSQKFSNFYAA